MKLKNKALEDQFIKAISKLLNHDFSVNTSYKLLKIKKELDSNFENFIEIKNKLIHE